MPEVLSSDRDGEGFGSRVIEIAGKIQHLRGRVDVGEVAGSVLNELANSKVAHPDFTGADTHDVVDTGGIDEEHEFVLANCVGNIRGELMQTTDLYFLSGKLVLQNLGGMPSDSVVAAERIAVGDDEDARTHGHAE